MRIALVTGSFLPAVGGLEWKVHHLAEEYTRRGHEAVVFARRPKLKDPLPVTPSYPIVRCSYPISGFTRFGLANLLFHQALSKHHRQKPFDVLHCHAVTDPTAYGAAFKKKFHTPVVATTCGTDIQVYPEINYGARLDPRIDRMVRDNLNQIDVVGSISSSVREHLEDINGTAHIADIPNGVLLRDFKGEPNDELRQRLGLSRENLLFLSLGKHRPIKGYEYAVRGFASVAAQIPHAHYVLVGKNMHQLLPLAEELGAAGRVHCLDQVPMDEVPQILHGADVFVSPSLMEGFSQVNVQAMACGLPCVLSDAPGNRDAGLHGGALLAPAKDAVAMGEEMARIANDNDLRHKLAEQALAASEPYDWEVIADQYLDIFEKLIARVN